ncbi:hypothetical protein [Leekyejoonella antrihumi]|uniref:Uncharacterized protein n=1 Tax=Leekyejoonella antrihumi TaxID=1660198 RepID=A0A563DT60_9MICO|nr:hypothetical protein [Leekyejoonella antrihumi]TWP33122.1 hypothetical protein FGL98_22245 [Leekyejoonella antrihumi]
MILPPSVLRPWIGALITQTMRSVGHAYTTRIEALSLLVADGYTRPLVCDQVDQVTAQPADRSVVGVLAVLGHTADPVVLHWLIRRLGQDRGPRQWGAAIGLLTSIVAGTLSADLVPALSQTIVACAEDRGPRSAPAFMLAQRLSPDLTTRVVARLGYHPAPAETGARVQSPDHLAQYVYAARGVCGRKDPMLERALREGLSPDFIERRHHALLLLSFSPYREVLARTALDLLDSPCDGYAPTAAHTVLTYLAGPDEAGRLRRLLSGPDTARPGKILVALARSGGVPDDVSLLDRARDPAQSPDAVYAAGMSAHPDLATIATVGNLAGTQAQAGARWWQRTGGAITDLPATHLAPAQNSPRASARQDATTTPVGTQTAPIFS